MPTIIYVSTLTIAEGEIYAGYYDVDSAKPHGIGTLTYDDGMVKKGQWVKGQLDTTKNFSITYPEGDYLMQMDGKRNYFNSNNICTSIPYNLYTTDDSRSPYYAFQGNPYGADNGINLSLIPKIIKLIDHLNYNISINPNANKSIRFLHHALDPLNPINWRKVKKMKKIFEENPDTLLVCPTGITHPMSSSGHQVTILIAKDKTTSSKDDYIYLVIDNGSVKAIPALFNQVEKEANKFSSKGIHYYPWVQTLEGNIKFRIGSCVNHTVAVCCHLYDEALKGKSNDEIIKHAITFSTTTTRHKNNINIYDRKIYDLIGNLVKENGEKAYPQYNFYIPEDKENPEKDHPHGGMYHLYTGPTGEIALWPKKEGDIEFPTITQKQSKEWPTYTRWTDKFEEFTRDSLKFPGGLPSESKNKSGRHKM